MAGFVELAGRFFLPPSGDAKGREVVPLADAIRKMGDEQHLPTRVACERLAEHIEAGRMAAFELTAAGEARPADGLVWQGAFPAREECHVGLDADGREYGYSTSVPARPAIEGHAGVAAYLRQLARDPLRLQIAMNGQLKQFRMGLLLDELEVVMRVAAPMAAEASAPAQAGARRPVGKPVPGLPDAAALVLELEEEKRKKKYGAVMRVARKYGCSDDTIRRSVASAAKPGSSVFNMAKAV